jgi:tape measure domain-containing protein
MDGQNLGEAYIAVGLDLRQAKAHFENFTSKIEKDGIQVKVKIDPNILRQLQQIKIDPSSFQATSGALKGISTNFKSITNDLIRAASALKAVGGGVGVSGAAEIAAAKASLAQLKAVNQEIRNQQAQQKLAQQRAIATPQQEKANAQASSAQIGAQRQAQILRQAQSLAPVKQQKAEAEEQLIQIRLENAQTAKAAKQARANQPQGFGEVAQQKIQGIFTGGAGNSNAGIVSAAIGQAIGSVAGGLIGSAVGSALGLIAQGVGNTIGLGSSQEQTMIRLRGLTGSSSEASKALDGLKVFSEKLGLRLDQLQGATGGLVQSFVDFRTATKDTALQGGADRYFQSFTKGFASGGVTGEAQSGAFRAINQAIGKNQLSAEEIYGQLAEADATAPGRLARGLGLNQRQLRAQMQAGNITADIAIPRLAQQYEAGSKVGSALYAGSFEASTNRFGNALDGLGTNIGEVLLPVVKLGVEMGTTVVKVAEMGVELIKLPFDALGKTIDFIIGKTEVTEQAKTLKDAVKATTAISFEEGVARDLQGLSDFFSKVPGLGAAIRGAQNAKESDNAKGYRDTVTESSKIRGIATTEGSKENLAAIAKIDEQLATLQTKNATLDPLVNKEEEFRAIASQTDALNRQRETLNGSISQSQELLIQADDTLKLQEQALAKKEEEGALTKSEASALAGVRGEREKIAKVQDEYNKALSSTINKSEVLTRSLQGQLALQKDQRAILDRTITAAKLSASQANLTATPEQQKAINAGIQSGSSRAVIASNQSQIASAQQQLADPRIQQLLSQLGYDGNNLEQVRTKINRLDSKSADKKALENALPLIESIQKMNDEIAQENQSLLDGSIEARNQFREVQKTVQEYFKKLADETQDIELLVKEISVNLENAPVKRELQATLGKLQGTLLGEFTSALTSIVELTTEPLLAAIDLEKKLQGIGRTNRDKLQEISDLAKQQAGATAGLNAAGAGAIATPVSGNADTDTRNALVGTLKESEGFRSNVYYDSQNVATIGYGDTRSDIVGRGTISESDAAALLAERAVNDYLVPALEGLPASVVAQLNPNQKAAIGSVAYNTGVGGLQGTEAYRQLAAGNLAGFADRLTSTITNGGELTSRRQAERDLFNTPYNASVQANTQALDSVSNQSFSDIGRKVAEEALTRAGTEFAPGLTEQCANFVRDVLKKAGVDVGVTNAAFDGLDTGSALASSFFGNDIGQRISDRSQIRPGDLLAFGGTYGGYSEDTITHVGVATGNNMMVDRSTSSHPVQERSIDTFSGDSGQFLYAVRPGAYGNSVAGNGGAPTSGGQAQNTNLSAGLSPFQAEQEKYKQALVAQTASANADTQQKINTILDQQDQNLADEKRKSEDTERQRSREDQDASIARTANTEIRQIRTDNIANARKVEDVALEAKREAEDIDRQLTQQAKLSEVIQSDLNLTDQQKGRLSETLGGYIKLLADRRAAVTQYVSDVTASTAADSKFQAEQITKKLRQESQGAIAESRSLLQGLGVSGPESALASQTDSVTQQFEAARISLTDLRDAYEELQTIQGQTAEQTAEYQDAVQNLNNQLDINAAAEGRAIALLNSKFEVEQRTGQANLESAINNPYRERVDLQATILDRNGQSEEAIALRRQARVSQIQSEFSAGSLAADGQRNDLVASGATSERADEIIANSKRELEQLRTLKLSQVNEEVKGFGENLRDNLSGSIDGVVGSLSELFKKLAESKNIGQTLKEFALNSVQSILDVFIKAGLTKLSQSVIKGLFGKKNEQINQNAGSAALIGGLPGEQSIAINQFSPAADNLSGSMIGWIPVAQELSSALATASLGGSLISQLPPVPIAIPAAVNGGGVGGLYEFGAAIIPKLNEIVANQQTQTGALQTVGQGAAAGGTSSGFTPSTSSGGGFSSVASAGLGILGSLGGAVGGNFGTILSSISQVGQQVTSVASAASQSRSPRTNQGQSDNLRFSFETVRVGDMDVISSRQLERSQSSINNRTRRSPVFRANQGLNN